MKYYTLLFLLIISLNFQAKTETKSDKGYKITDSIKDLDSLYNQGSNIVFPELTTEVIENLNVLGKIWGYLKYRHPAITSGKYNWDYELFGFLPEYLKVNDNKERDALLLAWINSYGDIPECINCATEDKESYIKPDFEWITSSGFSPELEARLMFINENRAQGNQHYVKLNKYVGNVKLQNEDLYEEMNYPDAGFRLLSLYRYWNIVQYFFPCKYMTDESWDDILKQYIPLLIHAEDQLSYELSILQLIAEADDSHGFYGKKGSKTFAWRGHKFPPLIVRFIENKLVITSFLVSSFEKETHFEIGDIVTHINGEEISDIIARKSKYYPASNEASRNRNISRDILRSNDSLIHLRIERIDSVFKKELKLISGREYFDIFKTKNEEERDSYKMLDNNIGYVTLDNILKKDVSKIKKQFKNTRGIVIDIRNYPNSFVPFTLGSYFVSQKTPFVKFSSVDITNPGAFEWREGAMIKSKLRTYKGKLIVLVNEITQSQAEYTAMAFRAGDNTTIVGSTTAGADGNIFAIFLPGGIQTAISGLGVYYPDGSPTQRVGIVPDVEVHPTIQGIREGKDELLEKAIELILKQ